MISLKKIDDNFYRLCDDNADRNLHNRVNGILDQYSHVTICDWSLKYGEEELLRMGDMDIVDDTRLVWIDKKVSSYIGRQPKGVRFELLYRGKPITPNKYLATGFEWDD